MRDLIREKIALQPDPVFVLSHSLGGIACFETMVEARPANVKGLITAGSQAPLLYEFNALNTLRNRAPLPTHFPPWLNIYDQNDVLSYCAHSVFGCQADLQVDSMLEPLAAHGAYWNLERTWVMIKEFIHQHG